MLPSAFFFPVKGLLVPDTTTLGSLCVWGGGKGGGSRKLGCRWQDEIQDYQGVSWVLGPAPLFSHHHCSLGRVGFPRVPFIDKETEVLSQPLRK